MEKNENGYSGTACNRNAPKNDVSCSDGLQLAMVYSPYQSWRMIMSPEDALAHGTLFEELYKPLREGCND